MAPTREASTTPASTPNRPRGRPRRGDVEDVVLRAAIELLTERGIEGTTVSAVVERSGVARASVYLRWPNRQALISAAVKRAMGPPVLRVSGDVEADLRQASQRMGAILESASFRNVLPALIAGLTREAGGAAAPISFDVVAPGAVRLRDAYEANADRQGFRREVPPQVVVDLIVGGQIGHYMATAEPPDAATRDALLDVVLEGLRRR